jgi:hypothetical protein
VANKANGLRKQCSKEVEDAKPKLKAAQKALDSIKKEHIDEIRSLGKPPPTIELVLKAVCVMCSKPVKRLPSKENPKITVDDWWATSVAWMANTNKFMADLTVNFKPDSINPDVIDKIKEMFIGNPEFSPARVAKANKACEGMCKWVIKLVDYDKLIR